MAKHAHKLILINGKTWKCALPGCTFFVHLGLAHVLINRPARCWKCSEEFSASEESLSTGKSICGECDTPTNEYGITATNAADARIALVKMGMKHINEIDSDKIDSFRLSNGLSRGQIQYLKDAETIPTETGIEVKSEHRSDCASLYSAGLKCDCKDVVDYE